eukprot:gene38078-49921_t
MFAFILQRLFQAVIVMVSVALIAFLLFQYVGDPVVFLLGQDATPQQIAELRADLGLDRSFVVQFWNFLANAVQGEFGLSLRQGAKVSRLIAERLPATLELAGVAALLALVLGIPMGVYAALKRGTFLSQLFMTVSLLGVSLPTFLVGILLILLFSVSLGWLPASGYVSPFEDLKANLFMHVVPIPVNAPAQPRELSPARRALLRLVRRRGAMLGLAIVLAFVLIAVLAPVIAPQDPLQASWSAVRKAPSAQYLFGTDDIGRDVLSRVIWGARASLLAGLVSVCIAMALGVPIGLLAGYLGGWVDGVISRLTDSMLAVPFLILAIALAAFLGPSLTNAMIAIGVSSTPIFIRLTRGQVLSVKVEDFVEAARAVGGAAPQVLARWALPG